MQHSLRMPRIAPFEVPPVSCYCLVVLDLAASAEDRPVQNRVLLTHQPHTRTAMHNHKLTVGQPDRLAETKEGPYRYAGHKGHMSKSAREPTGISNN